MAATVIAGSQPASAQIIASGPPNSAIYAWGNECCQSFATFGQTFEAPGSQMDYFSFWIFGSVPSPTIRFRGHVMAFSGGKSHGSPLFSSSVMSLQPDGRIDVGTPGLSLTAGQTYVAFVSVSGLPEGVTSSGSAAFQYDLTNSYQGGTLVWLNDGGDTSLWSNERYHWYQEPGDMQFEMGFSEAEANVAPEPGTMVLLASGLAGVAVLRRRHRRLGLA